MELSSFYTDRVFYFESVENTGESKISIHYHDMVEIYYLTYGICDFLIGDKIYKIRQGDVVFIPKGVFHKTNYLSARHSRMLINCTEEILPKAAYDVISRGTYVFRSVSQRGEIDSIFKQIKKEYYGQDDLSDDALIASLSYLLVRVLRSCSSQAVSEHRMSCSERAIEFIKNNYTNKISLSDAAEYCGVSNEHLSRIFKKQVGRGFNEYLCSFRLKRAEEMLVNQTGFSISDIAFRCGFNDSNYFSSSYKKFYGISPSERRKNL